MKELFFSIMLVIMHGAAFSQSNEALSQPEQQDPSAIIYPPRISTPSTRDAKADPNPESIWVNREETVNGKLVTTLTPEELLQDVLLGQGNTCGIEGLISNVSFTGYGWNQGSSAWTQPADSRSLSYFSHGTLDQEKTINGYTIVWSLDMESGLLLTTGVGREAEGPNDESSGCDSPYPYVSLEYDPELSTLIDGSSLVNGAILEFDFVPLQDEISFDYIFASEEYPEFVHSSFNDVFGFFISEVDANGNIIPGTTQNIALLPDGAGIVSINNVNNGYTYTNSPSYFPGEDPTNPQYYVANYEYAPYQGTYMQFDGRTTVLTARADVVSGNKYHLKLAIANVTDESWGSGVFLRAGSLNLGSGLKNFGEGGVEIYNVFEGCENMLVLNFPSSETETTSIEIEYSGSAVNDILQLDDTPMPVSFALPPLETSLVIPYKVLSPVTLNGGEIKIIATTTRGGCERIDTIDLTVYRKVEADVTTTFDCGDQYGTITVTATGGSPDAQMSIDDGVTWQPLNEPFNDLPPGEYQITITDGISCNTLLLPVTLSGHSAFLEPSVLQPKEGVVRFIWKAQDVTGFLGVRITRNEVIIAPMVIDTFYTDYVSTGDHLYCLTVLFENDECEETTQCFVVYIYPQCDAAENVTATIIEPDKVLISWMPVDAYGFVNYSVFRDDELLDNTTQTLYTDENVPTGTHTYSVVANYDKFAYVPYNCAKSAPAESNEIVIETCAPIENLQITESSAEQITLTWEYPDFGDNPITFDIYRDFNLIANVDELTYTDEDDFVAGVTYQYCVQAVYKTCQLPPVCVAIYTPPCVPVDVTNVVATGDQSTKTVTLTWEYDDSNATFDIFRNNNLLVGNITDNTYTDDAIEYDITYKYCVTPVAACIGGGSACDAAVVETPTGIDDISTGSMSEVRVYPNPANSHVIIKGKDVVQLDIYNTFGQLIATINSTDNETISIVDISGYESGVYIFKLYTADKTVISKLVVVLN